MIGFLVREWPQAHVLDGNDVVQQRFDLVHESVRTCMAACFGQCKVVGSVRVVLVFGGPHLLKHLNVIQFFSQLHLQQYGKPINTVCVVGLLRMSFHQFFIRACINRTVTANCAHVTKDEVNRKVL